MTDGEDDILAPEADDSVRADVIAALAEHGVVTDESKEPAAADVETDAQKSERLRNERGQFTKAEGADPSDTPAQVSDAAQVQEKTQELSNAPVVAPKTWSADEKALFATSDPALQKAIARRDAEIEAGGRQWSEQRQAYEAAISPVREVAQKNGVNEAEAIRRLVNASNYLDSDPVAFIRDLAQQRGIDLTRLTQGNQQPRPQTDPQIAHLANTVAELQAERIASQTADAHKVIESFAKSSGHEFFEDVRVQMSKLMTAGIATSMDDAYDQAVWARPDLREKVLAAQGAKLDADRKAKEKERTEKARRGAISLNGSPNGATAPAIAASGADDIRSIVSEQFYAAVNG